jgi:hypothetical protein
MSSGASHRDVISLHFLGRNTLFPAFFRLYDTLFSKAAQNAFTRGYKNEEEPITNEAVIEARKLLTSNCQTTFRDATSVLHASPYTLRVAVQAMLMLDCTASDRHTANFRIGDYRPTSWLPDEPFLSFVERSLPVPQDCNEDKMYSILARASSLRAKNLQKRLSLEIRKTDNIAQHLVYDREYKILYVFHQVGFLKAQLAMSKGLLTRDGSVEDGIKQ